MLTKILRALRWRRRRSSTHLTPAYEARRVARLKKCQALFREGKVGKYHPDAPKAQAMLSGEVR